MAASLAQEKGTSSWLTALPVQAHGFFLHKTAFRDALAYDMVGFPPVYLLTVHVVKRFLLIMLCLVQRENFHQFAIMRLGIWLQIY